MNKRYIYDDLVQSLNGKLTLKAELSSDDYSFDRSLVREVPKIDINYGINYKDAIKGHRTVQ